jgi:hypothetical protein
MDLSQTQQFPVLRNADLLAERVSAAGYEPPNTDWHDEEPTRVEPLVRVPGGVSPYAADRAVAMTAVVCPWLAVSR